MEMSWGCLDMHTQCWSVYLPGKIKFKVGVFTCQVRLSLREALLGFGSYFAAWCITSLMCMQIASKLEAANKVKEPLKSSLLNGKWELLYTTSQSILQTKVWSGLNLSFLCTFPEAKDAPAHLSSVLISREQINSITKTVGFRII